MLDTSSNRYLPCLYIMRQTKDGDRAGLHLLGEIPLSCEISLVRLFYSDFCQAFRALLGIVQGFLNACEGLQVAPWRDLAWIGTFWERSGNFMLFVPTLVSCRSSRRSAVVFPQQLSSAGHCLELYRCGHVYTGIVIELYRWGRPNDTGQGRESRHTWVRLSFI